MTDLYQIDDNFSSFQDENLMFLDEFIKRDSSFKSGLIFVDRKDFQNDEKEAIKKISDPNNQSWGILEDEVKAIIHEKERLVKEFTDFYTTVISHGDSLSSLTPHQIQYIIFKLKLRIRRLDCVIDTKYTSTKFTEKKTNRTYLMAKGYWIDNNGSRVRSISRGILNEESSITEIVMKLLKTNKKSIEVMQLERRAGYTPDFTVYDNHTEWFVEIKNKNMNDLVKSFIMFETWKLYKNEYKLLA